MIEEYPTAKKEMTALRMLNIARKNALIDSLVFGVSGTKLTKKWHFVANRSLLCEEEKTEEDLIISDIIGFSYLPNLTYEERLKTREKIFLFLSNEKTNEDEMLSLAVELSKKAKKAHYPKGITEWVLFTPMAMRLKAGRFMPDDECLASLCGPSPLFAHLLNRSKGNVGHLYELLSLVESTPKNIMDRYALQESTIKKLLSEEHYTQLFYFLLLLNRQGKYLYVDSSGLRPENFNAKLFRTRNHGPAVLIGLADIFTTKDHINWFVKEFVEKNGLEKSYLFLEDTVGTIVPEMLSIAVSADGVEIIYMHEKGFYTPLG